MQVNLMWQANVTPIIYAYEYLNGPHNFNNISLAPLGYSVKIHKNPDRRASWSPHSFNGWYLVTSTNHYHYYNVWIK